MEIQEETMEQIDACLFVNRGLKFESVLRRFQALHPQADRATLKTGLRQGRVSGRYDRYRGIDGYFVWKKLVNPVENVASSGSEEEESEGESEPEENSDSEEEAEEQIVGLAKLYPDEPMDQFIANVMQPYYVEQSVKQGINAVAYVNVATRTLSPMISRVFFAGGQGSGKTHTGRRLGRAYAQRYYASRMLKLPPFSDHDLDREIKSIALFKIRTAADLAMLFDQYRVIILDECDKALKAANGGDKEMAVVLMDLMLRLSEDKAEGPTLLIFVGYADTFDEFLRFDRGFDRRLPRGGHVELLVRPEIVAKKLIESLVDHEWELGEDVTVDALTANADFNRMAPHLPYLDDVAWSWSIGYAGVKDLAFIVHNVKEEFKNVQKKLKLSR